jgi:hypothetical protein
MNEVIIRQFALDIERNAREVERMSKQVKRMRRRTVFACVLAGAAIGYAVFLDQHVEKKVREVKNYVNDRDIYGIDDTNS